MKKTDAVSKTASRVARVTARPLQRFQNSAGAGKLSTALFWLSQGAALVPIQPRSKYQVKSFGTYQNRIATAAKARSWFGGCSSANVGIICEAELVCLDFDDWKAFEIWRAGPGAQLVTRIESTGRGAHVYLRTAEHVPAGLAAEGVEIKAGGAVVMVAPSLHPSGQVYTVIADVPLARVGSLAQLFSLLSKPNSQPVPIAQQSPAAEEAWWTRTFADRGAADPAPAAAQTCSTISTEMLGSLVAQLKAALPVLPIARELVPDLRSSDGGRGRWWVGRCPFHPDRSPSLWVDAERGTWGCRSRRCPQRGTHDALNLEALRRGLTIQETIRTLAMQGPATRQKGGR